MNGRGARLVQPRPAAPTSWRTCADIAHRRIDLRKMRAAHMEKAPDITQKALLLKRKETKGLSADEEDLLNDILEYEKYKREQARLDADERE